MTSGSDRILSVFGDDTELSRVADNNRRTSTGWINGQRNFLKLNKSGLSLWRNNPMHQLKVGGQLFVKQL